MKCRNLYITLLSAVVAFGFYVGICCAGDIPTQYERDMLNLINQARQNPLEIAISMGMDAEQLLDNLPGLYVILTEGLSPLSFNENLYGVATQHSLDMFANNYFSHYSLDGSTYTDRIINGGVQAVYTGESLAILGFNNLINPEDAVRIMFEKMFIEELDPLRKEKLNILDPDVTLAGVSICNGTYVQDGILFNAYIVTCNFADDVMDLDTLEAAFLEMVNKARKDPLAALEALGFDEETVQEIFADDAYILNRGLPPLAVSEKLYEAAVARSLDLDEWFFGNAPVPGEGLDERIISAGYAAEYAGEAIGGMFSEEFINPFSALRSIFEGMILEELSISVVERKIFNPLMTETGLSFRIQNINLGDFGDPVTAYALVTDYARPSVLRTFLVGNVYHDYNADGDIDPGEGIVGARVSLRDLLSPVPVEEDGYPEVEGLVTYTGPRGSYQIEIPVFSFNTEAIVRWDQGPLMASYLLPFNINICENRFKDFVIRGANN